MEEQLIPIGFFLVLIGIVIIIIGSILTVSKSKTRIEWGFGGFIGPIPFGAASREDILKLIIIISLIFLILFLVLGRGFLRFS